MKPETRIVNKIVKRFRELQQGGMPLWFVKIHGSNMQRAGVPDILGCYCGRMFGLEVKTEEGEPTPLQQRELMLIGESGGVKAVVRTVAEAEAVLIANRLSR